MRKPEHVEQLESGGMMCRHCGGRVDDEGYAMGGDIDGDDDGSFEESLHDGSDELPEQYQSTERMRHAAFAEAVKRRRGD